MMTIIRALEKLENLLKEKLFVDLNKFKSTYFSRSSCKMKFEDTFNFVLGLPKASCQIEVNKFLKNHKPDINSMAKQSVFEARLKLKPQAFIQVNNELISSFYLEEHKLFMGYRIVDVDGSSMEVPSEAEEYFGGQKTSGATKPLAQVCSLYDPLNNIILDATIDPYVENERKQALKMIDNLQTVSPHHNLFVLDRGFPSCELISTLYDNSKFLFRVNSQFLKEINLAKEEDQVVKIASIGNINLRVINVLLDNGESEKLFTNIFDADFTPEVFKQLYNHRWGIECKYRELKSILEIENFSSANRILIEQDFYASVVVANLVAIAKEEANQKIADRDSYKSLKYDRKLNTNMSLSELKLLFIKVLCTDDPLKKDLLWQEVCRDIIRYSVPIRPNRKSTPRTAKHPSSKFPLNSKSAS